MIAGLEHFKEICFHFYDSFQSHACVRSRFNQSGKSSVTGASSYEEPETAQICMLLLQCVASDVCQLNFNHQK